MVHYTSATSIITLSMGKEPAFGMTVAVIKVLGKTACCTDMVSSLGQMVEAIKACTKMTKNKDTENISGLMGGHFMGLGSMGCNMGKEFM